MFRHTKGMNKNSASIILCKTDYILMGILCLLFSVMVFFRIGNLKAPQTSYNMTQENREIVLDFGGYIPISQMQVYLGYTANTHFVLSAFNEVTGEWEIVNDTAAAGSVFQWNGIDVNWKLRYLGIVCTDEEAELLEIAFRDTDGNAIIPLNTTDYPTLFDEQELIFDTEEKTYMDGTMFDEVYHGRTGYEFVHALPTYETTHPQLGKCLIALGIRIFGMTPFGMRFFVALFGIAFIPLMYIFAKRLFDNTFVAFSVGMLMTFDCMHYTLSRIATIDIFVAFFIVATYYFMYVYFVNDAEYRKNPVTDSFPPSRVYMPLAMSGIMLGFAVSTKLTGVYAGVGLAVMLLIHLLKYPPKKQTGRLFGFCLLFFILFPLVIYTLAYIPVVEEYAQMGSTDKAVFWNENGLNIGYGYTGLLARTVRNTNYMINYHRNLVAQHYYASPFYEWPFIWKPLLAANDSVDSIGKVSSVSYMGNPAIWWVEIPCLVYVLLSAIENGVLSIRGRIKKTGEKYDIIPAFLIVAYLAQYIPWIGVSRLTFIYHYFPSAIFGMLIIGYVIAEITKKNAKAKWGICIYLGITVMLFAVFFPVISGLPVSREYGISLRWLPEWILAL